MSKLNIHDEASAPAPARPALEVVKAANGMIPNMLGMLAENPAALDAYLSLSRIFDTAGFTPLERQVVLLTVSIENTCHFCVAAHSAASAAAGLDMTVIEAVRNKQPLPDPRLEGLRLFTRRIVRQRELPLVGRASKRFAEAVELLEQAIAQGDDTDQTRFALERLRGLLDLARMGYTLVENLADLGSFSLKPLRGILSLAGKKSA